MEFYLEREGGSIIKICRDVKAPVREWSEAVKGGAMDSTFTKRSYEELDAIMGEAQKGRFEFPDPPEPPANPALHPAKKPRPN